MLSACCLYSIQAGDTESDTEGAVWTILTGSINTLIFVGMFWYNYHNTETVIRVITCLFLKILVVLLVFY